MPFLTVGGMTIKVAPDGVSRDRLDHTDRRRSFDGTYRASQTGNPKRDFHFSTPPISRVTWDLYEMALSLVGPQICSGDILGNQKNAWLRSEELDHAVWTKADSTIFTNDTTAPDGTLTAEAVVETATTAAHYAFQLTTVAGTISTPQTASFFLKAGGRSWGWVYLYTSAVGLAFFDLVNGVVGTVSGTGSPVARITPAPFGFYRCELTATIPVGGVWPGGYGTATADGVQSFLGDITRGVWGWGGQADVDSSSASSYAKTTTAAVNPFSLSCCTEVTGWTPVKVQGGHYVVGSFVLHEV